MIWTKAFWQGAGERAIKTFSQTLAAYFTVGVTGLLDLDWGIALSISGAAALASLLTSVGNADFTAGTKVVPAVVVQPEPAASTERVTYGPGWDPEAGEYVGEHRAD